MVNINVRVKLVTLNGMAVLEYLFRSIWAFQNTLVKKKEIEKTISIYLI